MAPLPPPGTSRTSTTWWVWGLPALGRGAGAGRERCGVTYLGPIPVPHKVQPLPPLTHPQFLGDYVDRGAHSLETICLLLALKIEYPTHVHLIRGNHEAADINALFGFRLECLERLGDAQVGVGGGRGPGQGQGGMRMRRGVGGPRAAPPTCMWAGGPECLPHVPQRRCRLVANGASLLPPLLQGIKAWNKLNQLFNWLPLAANIEDRVVCMHGGIGRSINSIEQIEELQVGLVCGGSVGGAAPGVCMWWVSAIGVVVSPVPCARAAACTSCAPSAPTAPPTPPTPTPPRHSSPLSAP